jgi:hypothetical protein
LFFFSLENFNNPFFYCLPPTPPPPVGFGLGGGGGGRKGQQLNKSFAYCEQKHFLVRLVENNLNKVT